MGKTGQKSKFEGGSYKTENKPTCLNKLLWQYTWSKRIPNLILV